MTLRPAKTQLSLGIRPVWSESSLSAWRKLGSLATHWAHSEDSDQTERTAKTLIRLRGCPGWSDLRWAHLSFCWFCHEATHIKQPSGECKLLMSNLCIFLLSVDFSYTLAQKFCTGVLRPFSLLIYDRTTLPLSFPFQRNFPVKRFGRNVTHYDVNVNKYDFQ